MTPLLAGALTAACFSVALLAVPLLLDKGPVDRLAARTGGPATGAALAAAAARRAPGRAARARGSRPASASAAARRSRAGSTSRGGPAG